MLMQILSNMTISCLLVDPLGMSGRLVHELEYHYSDGAFGDGPDANITIRYLNQKMD